MKPLRVVLSISLATFCACADHDSPYSDEENISASPDVASALVTPDAESSGMCPDVWATAPAYPEVASAAYDPFQDQNRGHADLDDTYVQHRLDTLIADERYQEAIWYAASMGLTTEAARLRDALRDMLTQQRPEAALQTCKQSFNQKTVLRLGQPMMGIFKPDGRSPDLPDTQNPLNFAAAEVAAYEIDQLLGLNHVPMTIYYTYANQRGSLQYVVQDTYSGCGLRKGERVKPEARTALRSMQVFDYLIGNPDRNSDNFLWLEKQNHLVAIDHGLAFRGPHSIWWNAMHVHPKGTSASARDLLNLRDLEESLLLHLRHVPASDLERILREAFLGDDVIGALTTRYRKLQDVVRHP